MEFHLAVGFHVGRCPILGLGRLHRRAPYSSLRSGARPKHIKWGVLCIAVMKEVEVWATKEETNNKESKEKTYPQKAKEDEEKTNTKI